MLNRVGLGFMRQSQVFCRSASLPPDPFGKSGDPSVSSAVSVSPFATKDIGHDWKGFVVVVQFLRRELFDGQTQVSGNNSKAVPVPLHYYLAARPDCLRQLAPAFG